LSYAARERNEAMNGSDARRADRRLAGLTVAVTRPASKGDDLAVALASLGARVIAAPALRLLPPADRGPLLDVARRLADFDWVMLTSSAAVDALAGAASEVNAPPPARVAVVGPRTAAAAAARGWRVDLVPERFDAEGLLGAIDAGAIDLRGRRVLLPLAQDARDVLRAGVAARGGVPERVTAYRAEAADPAELSELAAWLREGRLDLITLASPSAARSLVDALGEAVLQIPAAAVGPVTAQAARGLGYRVDATAEEHTMNGLVDAVLRWHGDT
jgi:uroporphyrinogen-III synthase